MEQTNAERVDDVINLAADAFRERLDELGETESGAYPFYALRLSRPSPLVPQETGLIDALAAAYGPDTTFYEIGAGVGFLALSLAARGYCAVAVESDPRRVRAAEHIRAHVVAAHPDIETRFFVEQMRFGVDPLPRPGPKENRIVALCTNLVNGWSHENAGLLASELARFDAAILDLLLFGVKRERERAQEVLDIFTGRNIETFLDMGGKVGLYARFAGDGSAR